jgi:hypothetical protein
LKALLLFVVEGVKFSAAKEYNYLGQVTSFEDNEDKQINARITAAWKSYVTLFEERTF